MPIDLAQLRTFVAVAEDEHLTRAADRLSMSQSAASAHVRAIEDQLRVQLFVRTNRRLELTHAGRLLAQRARALLREEASLASFARELTGAVEGRLVVGTSSEPGTGIGDILAGMRASHPLVAIDVVARASSGTRRGLLSGEIDVGLLIGCPVEPSFAWYELTRVPYRVAGPVAWRDAIDAADWSALAALPWLTPSSSSAYAGMLTELFGNKGLELNTVIRFDNASVGRTALTAGAGMMLLREDHALAGAREGVLAVSPLARATVPLSIAHQAARTADPLILAFLDAARRAWPTMAATPADGPTPSAA